MLIWFYISLYNYVHILIFLKTYKGLNIVSKHGKLETNIECQIAQKIK